MKKIIKFIGIAILMIAAAEMIEHFKVSQEVTAFVKILVNRFMPLISIEINV